MNSQDNTTSKSDSIFIKRSELAPQKVKLSLDAVKQSIPANSVREQDPSLAEYMTEWRWRILNINDSEIVEMSYKKPNEDRIYMSKTGKWKKSEVDPIFDRYVIETYYCYGDQR